MNVGPGHLAVLSAIVFAAGCFGVLTHDRPLRVLFSALLMLGAPVIALVGFTHLGHGGSGPPVGDALAALGVVTVAAEGLLGAGVALLLWRRDADVPPDGLGEVLD